MSGNPPSTGRDQQGQQSPPPSVTPGRRNPVNRSFSQSSWTDTPYHNQGTSYFPPTPGAGRTPSRSLSGARSLSVSSEHDEDDDENDDSDEDDTSATERRGKSPVSARAVSPDEEGEDGEGERRQRYTEDDPVTVKERQSLMNVDHPFGLPIWKPALYKKSRTVNRDAETALHATPTAYGELHLNLGNIVWAVLFGIWLAAICLLVSAILFVIPFGGRQYAPLTYGLGWYLFWPFGKYVAGCREEDVEEDDNFNARLSSDAESPHSIRVIDEVDENVSASSQSRSATGTQRNATSHSANSTNKIGGINERTAFALGGPKKSYGTVSTGRYMKATYAKSRPGDWLGRAAFWLLLTCIIAPLMLFVCLICWFLVVTVPMAKLNWELLKHMFQRPDTIRFCAAPSTVVVPSAEPSTSTNRADGDATAHGPTFTLKSARLSAGQAAPSGSPSTVLLCTYRAVGIRYYKYTVGGVNIFFVNLMAVVFFAILDGFVLLGMKDGYEKRGEHVPAVLEVLASRVLVFLVSLASVIPLSYFIGMAVASISAQSSIGMGAVINATFGSIIEIILYGIALTEGKGRLVEGSIIGSLLAGVLLMPGTSMCSGAVRKKEQKFNAKSAGVTSTMLIMAIIGTLTPTLFYQTYGNFELICDGCPGPDKRSLVEKVPWNCTHCYYEHPDPVHDHFYQTTVKTLMYFCAAILLLSYLIGLWFSLRTHASQIWQNPQPLMHPFDLPITPGQGRASLYHRLTQGGLTLPTHRLNRKSSEVTVHDGQQSRAQTPAVRDPPSGSQFPGGLSSGPPSPGLTRKVSHGPQASQHAGAYTPLVESVSHAVKNSGVQTANLPDNLTSDDFTRAVAVATVSALRHQQALSHSPARVRNSALDGHEDGGGHGGHEAPSWSRTTSASILLGCTALYAAIAEILVKQVDVILEGSGIDEKFLGLTLFALVPNTTEFMNAMSFAMYGNIALSMEIGSAYALQVCLLQIPAMVAFSAWNDPQGMGSVADTFTLIFPRWDVIAIVLSIFLLTYTYIEAKSNYHRGSTLILSYLVLLAGFYFAPQRPDRVDQGMGIFSMKDVDSASVLQRTWLIFSSLWTR
ncbi:uncharacterized protein FOMMEDRAFT_162309 [Fomitiporia mediterranea MF3/22]|uniref:uncharacterized protein n=1 Tax=Fomitiporia mediterranea (strain MF3/22) TaxID=694068 RepID=UPI000440961B|nr:uncharacterized protein FOMMEDRAFT_162309 [Fomitiporia mediterranea MF3/22]EJC97966.1 hypothetical protein FOMMEDRAFT_162309 [Fomitiporia mediterranea MF3/22]